MVVRARYVIPKPLGINNAVYFLERYLANLGVSGRTSVTNFRPSLKFVTQVLPLIHKFADASTRKPPKKEEKYTKHKAW